MHVRIAWEIYGNQNKGGGGNRGLVPSSPSAPPLPPPTSIFPPTHSSLMIPQTRDLLRTYDPFAAALHQSQQNLHHQQLSRAFHQQYADQASAWARWGPPI